LVELFETTGNVVEAEVLFENNRSTGSGIVQFVDAEDAGTSISKFSGYEYGGRPLGTCYTSHKPSHFSSRAQKSVSMTAGTRFRPPRQRAAQSSPWRYEGPMFQMIISAPTLPKAVVALCLPSPKKKQSVGKIDICSVFHVCFSLVSENA